MSTTSKRPLCGDNCLIYESSNSPHASIPLVTKDEWLGPEQPCSDEKRVQHAAIVLTHQWVVHRNLQDHRYALESEEQ